MREFTSQLEPVNLSLVASEEYRPPGDGEKDAPHTDALIAKLTEMSALASAGPLHPLGQKLLEQENHPVVDAETKLNAG